MKEAIAFGLDKYNSMKENDVKKAFKEFDADGSGAIDQNELSTICEKLGCPLSEKKLPEALKTLDLNGDGVIQLDEFERWYFTGMKPYGETKKSMLYLQGSLLNIFDVMKDVKELQAPKMKKNKIGISFNKEHIKEHEFKTSVDVTAHVQGGVKYNEILKELKE